MTIAELKIEIIQKIIETNDMEKILAIQNKLIENSNNFELNEPQTIYEKTPKKFVLNDWQKERIIKAQKQIENGEFVTEEEAEIELQKWFEEEEKLYGQ